MLNPGNPRSMYRKNQANCDFYQLARLTDAKNKISMEYADMIVFEN